MITMWRQQPGMPCPAACATIVRHVLTLAALCALTDPAAAQHQDYQAGPPMRDQSAFSGLAQAPEADLFVGSARTSIPIQVPPGRKQMTPKLALTYSSSAGASPYGYGWSLPLGRIQRSTRLGVLTCASFNNHDDFVLLLPERSVEFTRDGSGRGLPRIQEGFLRIQHNPTQNSWMVWDRSGIRYEFGQSIHARTGTDVGALYNSAPCGQAGGYAPDYTFSWELTGIQDPNGNRIDVTYAANVNVVDGVTYPERILYGGHTSGLAHQFEVQLIWVNGRFAGDEIVTGMGGFAARLTRFLAMIAVRRVGGPAIRHYVPGYERDVGPARLARQLFLSAVTLQDGSGQALARFDGLPASTTFLYHEPEQAVLGFTTPQNAPKPPAPPQQTLSYGRQSDNDTTTSRRDLFDITGDGMVDWIVVPDDTECQSNPFWYVYPGSVSGFATTPIIWDAVSCRIRSGTSAGDPRHTYTYDDTIDINGDGIPDFIEAALWFPNTPHWRVHLGYVTAAGGGFSSTYLSWPAPLDRLRHTISADVSAPVLGYGPAPGSVDVRDLIDMNADGLPDLVDVEAATPGTWRVWLNTGSGFESTQRDFPVSYPAGLVLRWTREADEIISLRDMNGDGLPDQVFAGYGNVGWPGYWYVVLNTGHAIDLVEQWPIPAAVGGPYVRRMTDDYDGVVRELIDMNGDGLPDLVDYEGWTQQAPRWQVVLNRGDGFSDAVLDWDSPFPYIRSGGNGYTGRDTLDIDGDGLVDFVDFSASTSVIPIYRQVGGAWCASVNGIACAAGGALVAADPNGVRTDLLVAMENGVGGTTELEYRPSSQWDNTGGDNVSDLPFTVWTLTRIERDDGLCNESGGGCISGGAHTVVTNVSYRNGRFDPIGRELRGFQIVSSRDADGSTPPIQGRTTYFHQGATLLGKVQDLWVYDAANGGQFLGPLTRSLSTWQCVNPTTGATITCPAQPNGNVWVRLARTDDYAFNNFVLSSSKRTSREVHAWSQCGGKFYGNVAHYSSGDPSGAPRAHHHTEYGCTDTSTAYVVDRPVHTWVNASNDTATLQEEWLFYDSQGYGVLTKGDLSRREQWLDRWTGSSSSCTASTKSCISTRMTYDTFGNLLTITDPLNRVVTTQYDTTQLYPWIVTTAAPFSRKTATSYDSSCGVLRWQSITFTGSTIPPQRSERQYDSFCRLTATTLPDEDIGATPHETYVYSLGGARQPSRLTILTREPSAPTGFVHTHVLTDALGRMVQQQQTRTVEGNHAWVVSTTSEYDTRGNARSAYAPFLTPFPGIYNPPQPTTTGSTRTDVDALNRPTHITNPDGSTRAIDHRTAWQTSTSDECFSATSCAGGMVTEIHDALGRLVEKQWHDESALRTRTVYTYDELGHLLTTRQGSSATSLNEATRLTLVYDTLGRKVQMTDPDSGVWRYGYDPVGNLRYQDDPRSGQHLQHCYDALDRMTLECPMTTDYGGTLVDCATGACSSPDAVRWYYDDTTVPHGLGRLTRVTDASGKTTFDRYDVRGRALQVTKEIDALGDGQNVTSATFAYGYDSADHLVQLTYPDGELVEYQYDGGGRVKRLHSATHQVDYVSNVTYDLLGRARVTSHGNGTTDTRVYGGANVNYRLSLLATNAGSALRLSYGYTSYLANGRLEQITDNGPKGTGGIMDNSMRLSYDGLGRLTGASGPRLGTLDYQYDYLGNITAKDGLTFTYGASKPHTLTQINGSSAGLTHDANGNRGGKPSQTYAYDQHDRLTQINAGQTRFRYDYTGRMVAKIAIGNPVHVYYSNLAESADGWLTKYYLIGDVLVASRRGQASGFAARAPEGMRLAAVSLERPMLAFVLRKDIRTALLGSGTVITLALLCAPPRRKRVVGLALRKGHVLLVATAVLAGTFPWPWVVQPAEGLCAPPASVVYHFHQDHLGSTHLITNGSGGVVEYVRYRPYGEIRGRYDGNGTSLAPNEIHRYEFTGYESEFTSGLQYAGARFYDPALGLFLTHDPARQFANPYAYGPWSPFDGTDPSGGFWLELFVAALIGAFLSAAINVVIAAAQGASLVQIGKAALRGAITGAVGVGLGVVVSGLSTGFAALAQTLPTNVTVQAAKEALVSVAYRSAFSTTLANAAGQSASALGAPDGLTTAITVVGGYLASAAFDQFLLPSKGSLALIEGKGAYQTVSSKATHSNITLDAAREAGFDELSSQTILAGNLAQDGPADAGLLESLFSEEVLNNETHFGAGARSLFNTANERLPSLGGERFLETLGAASHYLQDQYAVGHIFPGTHLLAGRPGWLLRGIIHQTVGGEVTFSGASYEATLSLFRSAKAI